MKREMFTDFQLELLQRHLDSGGKTVDADLMNHINNVPPEHPIRSVKEKLRRMRKAQNHHSLDDILKTVCEVASGDIKAYIENQKKPLLEEIKELKSELRKLKDIRQAVENYQKGRTDV